MSSAAGIATILKIFSSETSSMPLVVRTATSWQSRQGITGVALHGLPASSFAAHIGRVMGCVSICKLGEVTVTLYQRQDDIYLERKALK